MIGAALRKGWLANSGVGQPWNEDDLHRKAMQVIGEERLANCRVRQRKHKLYNLFEPLFSTSLPLKSGLLRSLDLSPPRSLCRRNRQTISFIEHEERTPTVDTLLRLTDAIWLNLEDVIRDARRLSMNRNQAGKK
jgi:hypothetical protein